MNKMEQLLIPRLYPYQEKILQNHSNRLLINKSRQVGISYLIACHALLRAIGDRKTELIISPSLRQSKHMMDYIHTFLNQIKKITKDIDSNIREETKTSIIFQGGGEIHSLPNSANTIRGYQADDIYIDEFAHFTNGTDQEVMEAIAPSISRGGNITLISTPFGDQNLFYQYWQRDDIDKLLINWRECPDLTPERVEPVRQDIGEDAFNQEYENQFLSDMEGQEFPTSLIMSCVDHELIYTDLDKNQEYLAGVDIGREQDFTVFTAFEKIGHTYILRYKKVMKNVPYREQLNFLTYMYDNHHFKKFHIDESGIGNMMAEELSRGRRITRITFNNENKQEMVGNLKRLMQEHNLQYPNDPQVISNLRSIKRIYTPSNYIRFDSDRDNVIGHADLFWSMALGLYDESKHKKFIMPVGKDW